MMETKSHENWSDGDLTRYVFEQISLKLLHNQSIHKAMTQVLHISDSSAYKKLNESVALSMPELALLARHFQISLDTFLYGATAIVPMMFPPLTRTVNNPLDFLRHVAQVMRTAIERYPDGHLYDAVSDMPVYLFIRYPELAAFKLFVWGRNTWGLDVLDVEKSPETLLNDPDIRNASQEILHWYHQIPSTAFWTDSLLDNTLNQINYFLRTGVLTDQRFVKAMYDQIRLFLKDQQAAAQKGFKHLDGKESKAMSAEFNLYHNEIAHTSNTLLFVAYDTKISLTTHDHPNFLITSDPAFTNHTYDWFKRVRNRAVLLSNSGEKQRKVFFDGLAKKIKVAEKMG